jgi:type I restriction enzyme, S subunit
MIGTLDTQVIEKFKEFQEKTGKYLDLDIENVEFESISLSDERLFTITMGQSPEGKSLNHNSKGMPFFQGKTDFGKQYLNLPTTWTTKSKKEAKSDDILISLRAPAGAVNIANIDLSIGRGLASIRCQKDIHNVYIYFYLKNNESKINNETNNGGFFSSMNKDYLYNLTIPIPKDLEKYKSIDIQKAIIEFLEYSFDNLEQIKKNIDKRYDIVIKMQKSLIPSTFKKTAIKNTFRKYAKENNIKFDITDIKFDSIPFDNFFENVTISKKIKNKEFKETAKYPVVSQSESFINGYFDDNTGIIKASIEPVIIFGDHTTILKYIDFDFLPGADGTKVLKCKGSILPKYAYFQSFYKVKSQGYQRHFRYFKEKEFLIPESLNKLSSNEIQQILANFIEKMNNEIDEKYFKKYNRLYEVIELLRETYLRRTFSKIVWS